MTISATTRSAAGISTSIPSEVSREAASERRRGDIASPATACEIPASAMTVLCQLLLGDPLRQLADGFLQQCPRLVAVFALPLGIEPGRAQFFAEWGGIRLVEGQSLASQFLLQTGVQFGDIGALVSRSRINILGDDGANILRHFLPGPAIGQEPETVPHVV